MFSSFFLSLFLIFVNLITKAVITEARKFNQKFKAYGLKLNFNFNNKKKNIIFSSTFEKKFIKSVSFKNSKELLCSSIWSTSHFLKSVLSSESWVWTQNW